MAAFYFAYGSNMNPRRVSQRQMRYTEYFGGVLNDFRLVFNKRSVKYPGAASANVVAAPGHRVEGVLYRLLDLQQIEVMDPFEGHPVRYSRLALPVYADNKPQHAWVYLANDEWITEGLKPARWYLNHLLEGEPHLSPDYFAALSRIECLPNSELEPD
ncbi:MAG: gamma-glutamylcyclotransferase family protein [Pseudomonadota bacterium]